MDSDEQLLDDAEPVEENKPKEVKKHKRSFDPRYAVPTNEEKQMMRDADMEVEVSMIEMEVSGRCLCHCLVHSCCSLILSFSLHSLFILPSLPCHSLHTPLSLSSHSPVTLFTLPLSLLSHSPYHSVLTPPGKPIHQHPQPKAHLRRQTHILPEGNERLPLLPPREGRNSSILHSHPRSPPRTSPRRACTAAFSPQQRRKRSSASASPPPSSSSAATSRRTAPACPSPST